MHRFNMTIPLPQGFAHWQARLAQSGQSGGFRVTGTGIGRLLRLSGVARYVEIGMPGKSSPQVEVTIRGGSASDEEEASRALKHIFSLDADLGDFYRHCGSNEPDMLPLLAALPGARMIREADTFTSVIDSMISQQLNLSFAAELKRRLWSLCGDAIEVDGAIMRADPTPEAIARIEREQLRALQFSGRKAEYIIDFARRVASGDYDVAILSDMGDEEAIASLCSVRGIGRWTAECVLLFGLGRQDLLPAGDVGLLRSASRMWGLPERIGETELRQRSASWSPWRSWYTYYLWLYDGIRDSSAGQNVDH